MDLLESESVHYFVLAGIQEGEGEGYRYAFQLTAKDGKKLGAVELAVDSEAHTQLIAVGTPTDKLLNPSHQKGRQKQQSLSGVTPYASKTGSFTTTWWDPVNIAVNWVKDNISFSYNGSTVTSYSGSDNRWWLSESGWFEVSHSIGNYYGPGNSSATVWTEDHMQNNTFCAGNTTHVYYQDNAVYGYGNGSVSGGVSTWSSGGCYDWLHYTTAVS